MIRRVLIFVVLVTAFAGAAFAQDESAAVVPTAPDPALYEFVPTASGFNRPILVTHAGDGSGRVFVVQQSGRVRIVEGEGFIDPPFLDVRDLISQEVLEDGYSERGLLGLAFHPNYAENGLFYINYTDRRGTSQVARYSVSANDPNVADPASAEILLSLLQPFPNHNGGHMAFGPDGYLYIAFGDGGAAGDPILHGQNPATLLGTILRLDVDSAEPYAIPEDNPYVNNPELAPEIWAWGLRNPWRFSFDRLTGDLYMGDVGQGAWEEINFQPADSVGGENYGWNIMEGNHAFSGVEAPDGLVLPVAEYEHRLGCSVSAGYVYRGEVLPELQGVFFYGDYCTGNVWTTYRDAGVWQTSLFKEFGQAISSFGEDEAGELYLVEYSGTIYRLEAR